MTLDGRAEKRRLFGSVWVLVTADGTAYELRGAIPDAVDGQPVQIECTPSANSFSMHMVGTPVDVTAIRVIEAPRL
jgi:hypothetical protein